MSDNATFSQVMHPIDWTQNPDDLQLRKGDLCPQCGQARLDYDGLLNLSCPKCGFALGGCFT